MCTRDRTGAPGVAVPRKARVAVPPLRPAGERGCSDAWVCRDTRTSICRSSRERTKESVMRDDGNTDTTIYKVVINHEEQYSIWPARRANAPGWRDAGKQG